MTPASVAQLARATAAAMSSTVLAQRFIIESAEPIAEAELAPLWAPYIGRDLTLADIEQVAAAIAALYRERGYLLARVLVPAQDARSGTVRLIVVPGRLGQLSVSNQSRVEDRVIRDAFAPLATDAAVTQQQLDRAMLLVSELPGATRPQLTFAPGDTPGTANLLVDVQPAPTWEGSVSADNWGSRYSGQNRLSADMRWASPFGVGDRLAANGQLSNGEQLMNYRGAYAIPLRADGLQAEFTAYKNTYDLGAEYQDLAATGTTYSAQGTLSWAVQRQRAASTTVLATGALQRIRDHIGTTNKTVPKQSQSLLLGLQHDSSGTMGGGPASTTLSASVTWGSLSIREAEALEADQGGPQTAGHYGRLNAQLAQSWTFMPGWTASGVLSLQHALRNRNLDSSEQLNVAGISGVKAYRESVTGDNGYFVGLDMKRSFATEEWGLHALSSFVEQGYVQPQNETADRQNGTRISDIGLGWAASWRDCYGSLQLARTAGPMPASIDPAQPRLRVLVQAGAKF